MTTPNLSTATGSVLGLTRLLGISRGKMRGLLAALVDEGLIECRSSTSGTTFRLTGRGIEALSFVSGDIEEFGAILSILRRPYGIAVLHIIKQLNR